MKRLKHHWFNILTACLLVAATGTITGCKTTPGGTTPEAVQTAINTIHAVVPVAVQYAVLKEPRSAAYMKLAADVFDRLASSTNPAPSVLLEDLAAIDADLVTPEASLAIMSAAAIYEVFFAQQVQSDASTVAVLREVAYSIRAGLPAARPTSKIKRLG